MSNSFNGDNWTLDTAQTSSIFDDGIFIRYAKWYPNASDNDILIENADGDDLVKSRAKVPCGANNDEIGAIAFDELIGFHRGFKLTTIDGGTLYIKLQ